MGLCTTRMLTVFRQGRTTKRTTYFCPIVLVFSMEGWRHTKPFHAGDATEIHVCFYLGCLGYKKQENLTDCNMKCDT